MSSYGRNFEFRVPPHGGERSGRWVLQDTGLSDTTVIPIGAPVTLDTSVAVDDQFTGAANVKLAVSAQAPAKGVAGILVYEYGPAAFAGDDPFLTTYSDKDTVLANGTKLVQVVSGSDIKVVLRNTEDRTFLNTRDYEGRTMVAGLGGATPTVEVGEYLSPGTGTDAAGYWAVSSAANGWMIVTAVDNDRNELEARLLF